MRHVLIVTRNFPPASHVSVERVTKLVKYLPRFGWRVTVLTGERGTSGLPEDASLLQEVAGAEVLRARAPELSWFYRTGRVRGGRSGTGAGPMAVRDISRAGVLNPKAWLIPDPHIFWLPFAVRRALAAATRHRWDAVLATTSPPSAVLTGHIIARRLGIPLVIDFRDAWTDYYAAPHRPPPLAALERRLEAHLVTSARAVIRISEQFTQPLLARLDRRRTPPVHTIPNGYDDEDFTGVSPLDLPHVSIVHTGQLRRTLRPLWAALAQLQQREPALRGTMHFWQVGWVDRTALPDLETPPEGVIVHRVPPVPLREAIRYMLGADLLFVEGIEHTLNAKVYPYLRAGRPILAIIRGDPAAGLELRRAVQAAACGQTFTEHETEATAEFLRGIALAPRGAPAQPPEEIRCFSREEIARRVAEVLTSVVSRP